MSDALVLEEMANVLLHTPVVTDGARSALSRAAESLEMGAQRLRDAAATAAVHDALARVAVSEVMDRVSWDLRLRVETAVKAWEPDDAPPALEDSDTSEEVDDDASHSD